MNEVLRGIKGIKYDCDENAYNKELGLQQYNLQDIPKTHGMVGWCISYGITYKEIICMLLQQDGKGGTWLQQTMERA